MPISNNNRTFEWNSIEQGFDELQWVLRAIAGKNDIRQNIQCLHIDVNFIVATDGHRMHILSNDYNAPIGLWRPKKITKKEVVFEEQLDMEFPEYDRVLPTKGDPLRKSFYVEDPRRGGWGAKLAAPFLHVLTYAKQAFNIDYLTDMLSLEGNWTVESTGDYAMRPLVAMRSETCLAVLMPIKS